MMNHLFDVADYAIDYAIEMALDAKAKGPCQCDEFYEKMKEAIQLMTEAQTAMHLFKGKVDE